MASIAAVTQMHSRAFLGRHLTAVSLIAGAIAWEVVGRVGQLEYLPPLSAVLIRLAELIGNGLILPDLFESLANLAFGEAIALIAGIGLGVFMGAYPRVEAAFDPYVTALNSTPSLVFAPIFFTFWGLSRWAIVALIVVSMLPFVIINVAFAIRNTPPELVEMGRSFDATDQQLFARVLWPAALPFILGTTRLAAGRGVKAMINGELFIAVVGLGAIIAEAGAQFDATTILAVMFVIGAVGFGVLGIVRVLESHFISWVPPIDAPTGMGRST